MKILHPLLTSAVVAPELKFLLLKVLGPNSQNGVFYSNDAPKKKLVLNFSSIGHIV